MSRIRRLSDKHSGVGVIYSEKSREEIAYCQRCLDMANVRSKLGYRIYFPDEFGNVVIPPDDNMWRQCHRCSSIYARYEVKQEADLVTLVKPGSPSNHRGIIRGIEKRRFDRSGIGNRRYMRKRKEQDLSQYKEEDLKADLRRGAKLISYHES
jgi:hypothetical protein